MFMKLFITNQTILFYFLFLISIPSFKISKMKNLLYIKGLFSNCVCLYKDTLYNQKVVIDASVELETVLPSKSLLVHIKGNIVLQEYRLLNRFLHTFIAKQMTNTN